MCKHTSWEQGCGGSIEFSSDPELDLHKDLELDLDKDPDLDLDKDPDIDLDKDPDLDLNKDPDIDLYKNPNPADISKKFDDSLILFWLSKTVWLWFWLSGQIEFIGNKGKIGFPLF